MNRRRYYAAMQQREAAASVRHKPGTQQGELCAMRGGGGGEGGRVGHFIWERVITLTDFGNE